MSKKVLYWLPALSCMLLIFHLSSQPRFTATGEPIEDFLIFKMLHMIEYGVLATLIFYALYNTVAQKLTRTIRWSAVLAVLYAVSDELHQVYVPTRSGTIRDVLIDAVGIILALIIIRRYFAGRKRP
ncbi:MAG: VanZ like family protein [Microgenomates bacterium OLB23]|nr:MAG: VanZ like family protein [Microgenomates bacterium OLB23]